MGAEAPLEPVPLAPVYDPAWSTPPPPLPSPPPAAPPPASGWVVATTPVARVEVAPGLGFASTGRRFGAWLIDWILVLLLIWLVEIPVIATSRPRTDLGIPMVLAAATLAYLVLGGYFVLGWRSRRRATPGMRVFGLQVGNAFDGRTLTLGQTIRRWIGTGYPLYLLTAISAITALAMMASLGLAIVLLLDHRREPDQTRPPRPGREQCCGRADPAGLRHQQQQLDRGDRGGRGRDRVLPVGPPGPALPGRSGEQDPEHRRLARAVADRPLAVGRSAPSAVILSQ